MMDELYSSWGRFPKSNPKEISRLFWLNEIPDFNGFRNSILPYGYGKSYGDSCQNNGGTLIDTKGLSRYIKFDRENGLFSCESGATLASILDFIVPQGWFLSVTPGTKFISVGGAVANDVHGKNHHRAGTFGTQVTQFELLRSDGKKYLCSTEENSNLFKATIGGLGLTGLITWVEFKIIKCPSPFFDMETIKFDSLNEFFDINADSDKNFDYTVSWVDTNAIDSQLGRGILTRGNFADPSKNQLPKLKNNKVSNFPFDAPFINQISVFLFNKLYYNKQINRIERNIVHYNPFFYPLDAVNSWNKAYGKNGFVQYQFVVPFENGKESIRDILKNVSKSGLSSFLTVLKTFGDVKSPGMLSFPRPGITMAIDFRFIGEKTLKICNELDNIVRNAGGVIYPAKDARMSAADFQSFYPQWKEFSKYIEDRKSVV